MSGVNPSSKEQETREATASWASIRASLEPLGPPGLRAYEVLKRKASSPAAVLRANVDKFSDWVGPSIADRLHAALHPGSAARVAPQRAPTTQGTADSSATASVVHAIKLAALVVHDLEEELADWPRRAVHVPVFSTLEAQLLERVVAKATAQSGEALLTVAVVGEFSSGKSTFINAILDRQICPVDPTPTTSSITSFTHGPSLRIELEEPGGERRLISQDEYTRFVKHPPAGAAGIPAKPPGTLRFHIEAPSPILSHIRLLDTPGFDNPGNSLDTPVTEDAVRAADVVFALFDINKGSLTSTLVEQLRKMQQAPGAATRRPLWLIVHKAGMKRSSTDRKLIVDRARAQYGDLFSEFLLVDSHILADAREREAAAMVDRLCGEAVRAVRSRAPFVLNINAEKHADPETGRAVFRVRSGRDSVDVAPTQYSDLASREDLLRLLGTVGERRRELLAKRAVASDDALRRAWASALTDLKRDLIAERDARAGRANGTGAGDVVVSHKDGALEELRGEARAVFTHALHTGVYTRDRRVDGFLVDDLYYGLGFESDAARSVIAKHATWKSAALIGKELEASLKDLSGVDLKATTEKYLAKCATGCFDHNRGALQTRLINWGLGPSLFMEHEDDPELRDQNEALLRDTLADVAGVLSDVFIDEIRGPIEDDAAAALLALGKRDGVHAENQNAINILLDKVGKALELSP